MCTDSCDSLAAGPGQHRGSGLPCISAALELGANHPRDIGDSRSGLDGCLNVPEGIAGIATNDPVEPPFGSVAGSPACLVLVPLAQFLQQKRLTTDIPMQFWIVEDRHHLRRVCWVERFKQQALRRESLRKLGHEWEGHEPQRSTAAGWNRLGQRSGMKLL